MQKYLFIGITLAVTVYAQLMLKWRALKHADVAGDRLGYLFAMYTDPGVLSALMGAVVASITWALAMQRASLSTAYPLMALSFVLVPLASVALFREASLSVVQMLGLGLVVLGISLSVFGR